jgi:uncharacterized membrane protein YqjE
MATVTTDRTDNRNEGNLAQLVGGILTDAQELTRKQLELFKVEIRDNAEKAKGIVALLVAGLAAAIVACILLGIAAAQGLLALFPELPGWAAYAIVGVALAVVAGILFGVCKQKLDSFSVLPKQSVEALEENLEWKTEQK